MANARPRSLDACLVYCRQSDSSGRDDSVSLEVQEAVLRKLAAEHCWPVAEPAIRDPDLRGWDATRPGLAELRKRCTTGAVGRVLVYSLDRLARKLVLSETIVDELSTLDVQVVSAKEPWATETLYRQILGAVAENRTRELADWVRYSIEAKAQQGIHWGPAPFGFRKDQGLAPFEPELEVVRRIFADYAGGSSLTRIANALERDGVPTPSGGRRWWLTTLQKILSNPVYVGRSRIGEYQVPVFHEHVIPDQDFARVQQMLADATRPRREKAVSSWVEGCVFHSCGDRMYLLPPSSRNKATFRCGSMGRLRLTKGCGQRSRDVTAWRVEKAAREALDRDLGRVLDVDDALLRAEADLTAATPEIQTERARIEKEIEQIQKNRVAAEDLLFTGRRHRAWFDERDAEFGRRLAELVTRQEALPHPPDPAVFEKASAFSTIAIPLVPALPEDAPELGEILAELGRVVVTSGEQIEIVYASPYRELLARGEPLRLAIPAMPTWGTSGRTKRAA